RSVPRGRGRPPERPTAAPPPAPRRAPAPRRPPAGPGRPAPAGGSRPAGWPQPGVSLRRCSDPGGSRQLRPGGTPRLSVGLEELGRVEAERSGDQRGRELLLGVVELLHRSVVVPACKADVFLQPGQLLLQVPEVLTGA